MFLLSKSGSLTFELANADIFDDHEFFLTSKQKRCLQEEINKGVRTAEPQEMATRTLEPHMVGHGEESQEKTNSAGRTLEAERTQGPHHTNWDNPGNLPDDDRLLPPWFHDTGGLSVLPGAVSPVRLPRAFASAAAMGRRPKRWKLCELFSSSRVTAAAFGKPRGNITSQLRQDFGMGLLQARRPETLLEGDPRTRT